MSVRAAGMHATVTGVFRRFPSGTGVVRTVAAAGQDSQEYFIASHLTSDAVSGDEVLVRVHRKPGNASQGIGEIVEVVQRATEQFVGTYFERDGKGYVRVDGSVFARSIDVGDPGAKDAKADDKVVVELLHFPALDQRGEGVIIEVLGQRGDPAVDQLSIIRALGIPDVFPEEALTEARLVASRFNENDLDGREDFTPQTVVTIDPVDARDFDDAVNVVIDPETKHWILTVHIADVAHFAPAGGHLDREARKRGTSVYLPQQVIPMFPEIISNGLASLQEGKLRYVKSAVIEFSPRGQVVSTRFANGAIRNRQRFTYEQVSECLAQPEGPRAPRRSTRGCVAAAAHARSGADPSQTAFQARGAGTVHARGRPGVRSRRACHRGPFRDARRQPPDHRRVHAGRQRSGGDPPGRARGPVPAPDPSGARDPVKLAAFAEFSRILGHPLARSADRFELQRILAETTGKPEQHAIHYALLRSLKQAVYSPYKEDHYALASHEYCHFTSPIRRYPDLQVHRQLGQWIRTGRAGGDVDELAMLGSHCSRTERRAENAEREIVKLRLLNYLSERIGERMDAVITGVADYGFFAQGEIFPIEG